MPASLVHPRAQSLCRWTGNGPASGNHVVEATLHALYEVLERHTISGLVEGGRVHFERTDVLELATVGDDAVRSLHERVAASGLRLALVRARSELPVHALMAIVLDPQPFGSASHVNVGYGAHSSLAVAACRAITEAAQSRLTFIHGSREDLRTSAYRGGAAHGRLYEFFSRLEPDCAWRDFADTIVRDGLDDELAALVRAIGLAGMGPIYQIDLSRPDTGIHVVHVGVVGARQPGPIFG